MVVLKIAVVCAQNCQLCKNKVYFSLSKGGAMALMAPPGYVPGCNVVRLECL